jgi:transposase
MQIFVAVLGASNYTYVEATQGQTLPDWIGSHVRALVYFQGSPAIFVPDNLWSGVSKAHWYEPEVNRSYEECARHFGAAVVPARVRRPRDKALAELGVQGVERQILARLRNHCFFSLAELNRALWRLLEDYNRRPFQKLEGSRRSLFETVEQPALQPLPQESYEYGEWKKARVNIDYHIAVDGHFYSVPYQLVKEQVDVRATATTVEVFHRHKRVASHFRGRYKNGYTTVKEHMPEAHRQYAEWTPERLVHWAGKTGGETAALIETILASRPHPQQGFRACLGIMRLGKLYGQDRLEAACARALALKATSFKSVESILKKGLDKQPLPGPEPEPHAIDHDNIRGPEYYS